MNLVLAPAVIQVAGVVIVGAVFIQSVFLIVSSFRRLAIEREQRRVTLDSLRYQAAIATAESKKEGERTALSWSGHRKFEIQRKVKEVEGVHSFYLVPHDGKPLPPFLLDGQAIGRYIQAQLEGFYTFNGERDDGAGARAELLIVY